jgi:hypothetical protein
MNPPVFLPWLPATICAIIVGTAATAVSAPWAAISPDDGLIAVQAPGLPAFRGTASASFRVGEQRGRVQFGGGSPAKATAESRVMTPFGGARLSSLTVSQPDLRCELTLRLKVLENIDAFTLQAVFHNGGEDAVSLDEIALFDQRGNPGNSLPFDAADGWLVTPLMQDDPATALAETNATLNEAATIRERSGRGFLVGPVGPAEAYTNVDIRGSKLAALVRMDGVRVLPGESRRSEEMIFCFEPTATAVDIWTRWVAITHGARLHRGPVHGWCSWYDRTTKIDEAHVRDVLKTIAENPDTFGKGVIQIDDGYQKMDGDWTANGKFPSGMAALARDIRAAGCVPGVWFAPLMINPEHPFCREHADALQVNAQGIESFMNANPFHPAGAKWLNPDHPVAKDFLRNIIKDARDRGYGYIKIDFNGIGSRFVDPAKTRLQVFRELYQLYREAAGEDIYILSCLGQPTRGVIGFIDSARVGPDSHPAHFEKCLRSVLRFQIFDNVWWQNDPDVSYLAPKLDSRRVGHTPQGEGMWRTWHNVNALAGGTAMISEPVNMPDVKEVWRNYEIMRPSSREPARLLTLGKQAENTIFGFSAMRPYGDFAVYNLYNCTGKETHLTLSFDQAGLPAGTECAVFDFWENRVIARTTGSYNTRPLAPLSSALLRFTPLENGKPVLVGSNLHLSMGATEIDGIRVTDSRIELILNDAGARDGSLTFHSTRPLSAGKSENCAIASVEAAGDDLWVVRLKDRHIGAAQSVQIAISRKDPKP